MEKVTRYSNPELFKPGFSTPDFSTMNSSTPDPYGVERFIVKKSGVERCWFETFRL